MTKSNKQDIISKFRVSERDTGSYEVQVALLTTRIQKLTNHLKVHRQDFHSRRGLIAMANHRSKLLSNVKRQNSERYVRLIESLGLRKEMDGTDPRSIVGSWSSCPVIIWKKCCMTQN
jgi:small subunit ribosomal protein S15